MNIADIVNDKINRLAIGYIFTYDDFDLAVNKPDALTKALNRMVKEGKIRKLSKGRFYKPRFTEFGELKPEMYQIVKDLLENNGKPTGYLTGYSTFNQLGLTTQVSGIIQIGSNEVKKGMKRGMYRISFIRQANKITRENIPLFRILDTMQYIKDIPDSTPEQSCSILLTLINELTNQEKKLMAGLALKYKPATRALAGAIIEQLGMPDTAGILLNSLKPVSTYKLNIPGSILPNKEKWNIK